ncbi:MAG: alpha-L-arabinofuranosidase C-terminal domain-containing protein [Kiritimatiellota bacterium]|nr:alpha-L-arabinofuranosidase C-terminal domain-containing protein [Kiritimatiellota bacterium]
MQGQTAAVRIDAARKLHRITPRFIGFNLEDLNYQTYGGLYSQMLFGESFQEHVDSAVLGLSGKDRLKVYVGENAAGEVELWGFRGRGWEHNSAREVLALTAKAESLPVSLDELPPALRRKLLDEAAGNRQVSRHWRALHNGDARAAYRFEREAPFIGKQSQRITFIEGTGEAGIDNAGLNRLGINLVKGRPYEGMLRIRADQGTEITASLLDAAGTPIAGKPIRVSAGKEYRKIEFTLTPLRSDPAGRFAISLKRPGSVVIGYAFLQPGDWGRFEGLPVRKDLVKAMLDLGVRVVRYDGSMVNRCPDGQLYKWKEMIGPRDLRKPYRGFFNPYASHGFGIFDFLNLAEKAGFLGIPGVRIDETPEDMADFVEYVNGSPESTWGRKRALDGHPSPYRLTHLEIGNEERLDEHYCERFETLARAVWANGPAMVLVISHNLAGPAEFKIGSDGRVSDRLRLALRLVNFAREHKGTIWWDSHYNVPPAPYPAKGMPDRIAAIAALQESVRRMVPGYDLPFAPLEENGQTHDLQRALIHARNQNAFARMGDSIVALGVANTFQASGQELIWSQGRIHFTPASVILQPPAYIDKLVKDTWAPQMVETSVSEVSGLDIVSRTSEDGRRLVMYAVNDGGAPVEATISIAGFSVRAGKVEVSELAGDPSAVNTFSEPLRIAPRRTIWHYSPTAAYRFPAHSYTVLQFE